jgi:hypothetical protein
MISSMTAAANRIPPVTSTAWILALTWAGPRQWLVMASAEWGWTVATPYAARRDRREGRGTVPDEETGQVRLGDSTTQVNDMPKRWPAHAKTRPKAYEIPTWAIANAIRRRPDKAKAVVRHVA